MRSFKRPELPSLSVEQLYLLTATITSKAVAYDDIDKRGNDAYEYLQKYVAPDLEASADALGRNQWHVILDDAIRMRKELDNAQP